MPEITARITGDIFVWHGTCPPRTAAWGQHGRKPVTHELVILCEMDTNKSQILPCAHELCYMFASCTRDEIFNIYNFDDQVEKNKI